MDKNFDLYCGCSLMVEAANHIGKHDKEFAKVLLDKTQDYMEQIIVDEKLIEEVKEYGRTIEQYAKDKNKEFQKSD